MKTISLEDANNLFRQFQNIFHSLSSERDFYYNCECIDLNHALFKENGNVTVVNAVFNEITFYLHKSYISFNGSFYEVPHIILKIIVDNKTVWKLELNLEIRGNNIIHIAKATSLNIPSLESLYILTDKELINSRNEEIKEAIGIIMAKYANFQHHCLQRDYIDDMLSLNLKKHL